MDGGQFPQEFMDAVSSDPGAFMGAMQGGMEAFGQAMQGGGDMDAAFQAFADTAGPMCEDMGISPAIFEQAGDVFTDTCGFGMQCMDGGSPAGDVGAVMQDAAQICCGDQEMPDLGNTFNDMAQTFEDHGCGCHDVGANMCESMPDGFVQGDPSTVPEGNFQPPPEGGACEMAGDHMMPPEGGYHGGGTGGMAGGTGGVAADGSTADGMAGGTGGMMAGGTGGGMAGGTGGGMAGGTGGMMAGGTGGGMAGGTGGMMAGGTGGGMAGGTGGMGALDDALGGTGGGGTGGMAGGTGGMAADQAIGDVMNEATEQGGAVGGHEVAHDDEGGHDHAQDEGGSDVDPSAGMG